MLGRKLKRAGGKVNFKQRAKARKRLWAGFPLSFEAGDTVIVTAKEEEAWWKGEVGGNP